MQDSLIAQSIDQPKHQQFIKSILQRIEQGTVELVQQRPFIGKWAYVEKLTLSYAVRH